MRGFVKDTEARSKSKSHYLLSEVRRSKSKSSLGKLGKKSKSKSHTNLKNDEMKRV
jgi:hypothetical protein